MRRLAGVRGLLWAVLLTAGPAVRAQTAKLPLPEPALKYVQLPVRNAELRARVSKSDVVVEGQLTAYKAGHDLKESTIFVSRVYKGKVQPGSSLSSECSCHTEGSSTGEGLVGYRVILFLDPVRHGQRFISTSGEYLTFADAKLEARLSAAVRGRR